MKRIAVLWTMTVMVLAGAGNAVAEPYVLLPPSALDLDFEGHGFRFVGDGFDIGHHPMSVGVFFSRTDDPSCDPCRSGDTFDPGFRTTGEVFLGTGPARLGSASYPDVTFYGTFDLDATAVTFPATAQDTVLLQTPFTFNGVLRGLVGGQQAFAAEFTGSGRAVRSFHNLHDGRFVAGENRQSYFFEAPADPEPIPEPATMLLFGTGAAIAGALRRRRQRCER